MQGNEKVARADKVDILPVGHLIANRYEVEQWWQGGMAVVYQTRDIKTDKIYAIKIPRFVGQQWDQSTIRQFQDEVAFLLGLPVDHRIVQVYLADVYNGRPYLVMEYVPGDTLATRLEYGQRLPYEQAVYFASQICTGMYVANGRGEVAHLDLKPSNLLITSDGLLKISDFGIAQHTAAFLGDPTVRTGAGTPTYMSPEQLLGEPVDGRSDIFSFGLILFRMLTGELPYPTDLTDDNAENARRLALLHRVLREDLPLTRQLAIDNDIDYDLVSRALSGPYAAASESMSYLAEHKLDQQVGPIVAACLSNFPFERLPDFTSVRKRLEANFPDFVDQPTATIEMGELTAEEWHLRGTTYQNIGLHSKALQCFSKSIVSNTEGPPRYSVEAYLGAVSSYLALGDNTNAAQVLQEVDGKMPGDPRIAKLRQQLQDANDTDAAPTDQ